MKKCTSDVKGLGKKPSKTHKKTMKTFPFFNHTSTLPTNTPGSGQSGPTA